MSFRMRKNSHTHNAYTLRRENPDDPFKRERRDKGYWIEIGYAWLESSGNQHRIFLDRLPTGGFTGHVVLWPVGVKPPDPETEPAPERLGT